MKIYSKTNIHELVEELKKNSKELILIDGDTGIGKTTFFAPFLADKLNAINIELDTYHVDLKDKLGFYTIDKESLKKDLKELLKNKKVILEGILVKGIIESMHINNFTHIYIESPDIRQVWDKDYGTYTNKNLEQIIALEDKNIKLIKPNAHLPIMRIEIIQYHFEERPFENADFVIKLEDNL